MKAQLYTKDGNLPIYRSRHTVQRDSALPKGFIWPRWKLYTLCTLPTSDYLPPASQYGRAVQGHTCRQSGKRGKEARNVMTSSRHALARCQTSGLHLWCEQPTPESNPFNYGLSSSERGRRREKKRAKGRTKEENEERRMREKGEEGKREGRKEHLTVTGGPGIKQDKRIPPRRTW